MDFSNIFPFFDWIPEAIKGAFLDLWEVVQDVFVWVLGSLLDLGITAANGLNLSGLPSVASAWAGLPPEVIEVMSAIGLTQALSIVISAIGIRLILQLVPFTRLGS